MPNVHLAGKISPEFTFFLKRNLHDAWKCDEIYGIAVCSAKKPEQRCDDACRGLHCDT